MDWGLFLSCWSGVVLGAILCMLIFGFPGWFVMIVTTFFSFGVTYTIAAFTEYMVFK